MRLRCLIVMLAFCAHGCGYGAYVRPGLAVVSPVSDERVEFRLLLVGDIGSDVILRPEGWPLLDRLNQELQSGGHSVVVFLGDNVYPAGVPVDVETSEARTAERTMRAVLAAASPARDVIFVPGNHDWNDSRPGGHDRILAQDALIRRLAGTDSPARLMPSDGCQGPISLDLASVARLVVIDTEWLLTVDDPQRKPVGTETGCTYGPAATASTFPGDRLTSDAFYEALEGQVQGAGDRTIVLLSHHPLRSRGPHGGHLGGSWLPYVWPAIRRLIPRRQDFGSSVNRQMRHRLDEVLQGADAQLVIAAAGHDHNLQVFDDSAGMYYLVSGSGSKASPAGRTPATIFKRGALGYMRLDFLVDDRVHLTVVESASQQTPLTVQLRPRP